MFRPTTFSPTTITTAATTATTIIKFASYHYLLRGTQLHKSMEESMDRTQKFHCSEKFFFCFEVVFFSSSPSLEWFSDHAYKLLRVRAQTFVLVPVVGKDALGLHPEEV